MWKRFLTTLLALALATSAAAQAPANPVSEHFRAYRAAMEAGDMASAHAAATAALAASEARDGGGGRTAVLALNLASLRLELGRRTEAIAPAQRANALAGHDVSPILTRLVLARAELTENRQRKSSLRAALEVAAPNDDLAGDVYLAAADLARREFEDGDYQEAADAWAVAVQTSAAAPEGATLGRSNALISQAVTIFIDAMRHTRERVSNAEIQADRNLSEAMRLLQPALRADLGGAGPLAPETRAYAVAFAWRHTIRVRAGREWPLSIDNGLQEEAAAFDLPTGSETCRVRIVANPLPRYPVRALQRGRVGTVVLAFHLAPDSSITSREVLAATPPGSEHLDAVTRVYQEWRAEPVAGNTPGCTQPTRFILVMRFGFDNP